ncbi:glutaredoxin family protein [bacterium]|nr:glutaredoxin family protein [bacterium]
MKKIKFYSLSTCIWCRKTRVHLKENGIKFDEIAMDKLTGDKREAAMQELGKHNPVKSFPTLVFAEGNVVVGFKPEEIRNACKK